MQKQKKNDYKSFFIPFFLVKCAPENMDVIKI